MGHFSLAGAILTYILISLASGTVELTVLGSNWVAWGTTILACLFVFIVAPFRLWQEQVRQLSEKEHELAHLRRQIDEKEQEVQRLRRLSDDDNAARHQARRPLAMKDRLREWFARVNPEALKMIDKGATRMAIMVEEANLIALHGIHESRQSDHYIRFVDTGSVIGGGRGNRIGGFEIYDVAGGTQHGLVFEIRDLALN
jgi:hypothetical protein